MCVVFEGVPRRPVLPTQRPGEQGFSQQFVRPHQLLEGKVRKHHYSAQLKLPVELLLALQLALYTADLAMKSFSFLKVSPAFMSLSLSGRRGYISVAE